MKAVILAAGKGTRMKDLTNEVPKPMLRVQGRPILEHILEGLLATGIREVCLITGWKAEVIEDHFGEARGSGPGSPTPVRSSRTAPARHPSTRRSLSAPRIFS